MEGADFGGEKYESAMDLFHNEVENCRQYVEEEFHRGVGNTWPNCIMSQLTAMNAFLDMAEDEGDISSEESKVFKEKLKKATVHAQEMQKKYKTVDADIPSQEKEEMLSMLSIFDA